MPVIDYNRTVYYQFYHKYNPDTTLNYIGATTNIYNRTYYHKKACTMPEHPHYNDKLYQRIRDNGGWNDWILMVLENYPAKNKIEQDERLVFWSKTVYDRSYFRGRVEFFHEIELP